MDRRRSLELQMRMVTATYRYERGRATPALLTALRARCLEILNGMADAAAEYPDLDVGLVALRQELERDELLAANRLHQEAVDPLGEPVD